MSERERERGREGGREEGREEGRERERERESVCVCVCVFLFLKNRPVTSFSQPLTPLKVWWIVSVAQAFSYMSSLTVAPQTTRKRPTLAACARRKRSEGEARLSLSFFLSFSLFSIPPISVLPHLLLIIPSPNFLCSFLPRRISTRFRYIRALQQDDDENFQWSKTRLQRLPPSAADWS